MRVKTASGGGILSRFSAKNGGFYGEMYKNFSCFSVFMKKRPFSPSFFLFLPIFSKFIS